MIQQNLKKDDNDKKQERKNKGKSKKHKKLTNKRFVLLVF